MKKILPFIFFLLPLGMLLFSGCGTDYIEVPVDPLVQKEVDLEIIQDYITKKGYTVVDTTKNGARYTIISEGTGAEITLNDNVTFNYIMRTIDDVVQVTTIAQVAKDNDIFDSTRVYTPRIFTYTESTWSINSILSSPSGGPFLETGFKECLVAATGKMKVGGHSIFIIPSGLMYGTVDLGSIPKNSVIVLEVFLVYVRPQ